MAEIAATILKQGQTDSAHSKVVIASCDPREAWKAPVWLGERMAQDFPQLKVVHLPEPGRLVDEIADSDVLIARSLEPKQFAGARKLKWFHALSTEMNQLITPDMSNRKIVITKAKDVQEPLEAHQVHANLAPAPDPSAATASQWERHYELIAENMARFLDGRPLLNQVEKRHVCKLVDLRNLLEGKFIETYYTKKEAERIVDVLLYGEMTGKNTQGVMKLLSTEPIQNFKPKYSPKVIKETKVSALIDGGGNAAILVCRMASEIAIQKCKESGIAIVGTHHTFGSSGAIGYYAEEMTKHDLIGMVFAGSPASVAPFGSIDPLVGTNPMAFGFPTMDEPVIFDMATAAITWHGLVLAQTLGQEIPKGLAIDEDGNPTTDPSAALQGAILPFDNGCKGSGLGLVVEILTGLLAGGIFANADLANWGNTFVAIDPDILVGKEAFKKSCTDLVHRIKTSRKAKGANEILMPGEGAAKRKKLIEQAGEVEIEDKVLVALSS